MGCPKTAQNGPYGKLEDAPTRYRFFGPGFGITPFHNMSQDPKMGQNTGFSGSKKVCFLSPKSLNFGFLEVIFDPPDQLLDHFLIGSGSVLDQFWIGFGVNPRGFWDLGCPEIDQKVVQKWTIFGRF